MSSPGGAEHVAPRRPRALDAAIEVAAVAVALLVALVLALRGRSLSAVPTAGLRPFVPLAFLLLLALLAWRARRAREGVEGPGRAPGRWLAGLRAADLVVVAAFLLVLLALPAPTVTLGADGQAYLEQLGGILLHGEPATHPGVEPGATVLWAPFYLVGHAVARVAGASGLDVAASGASEPYRNALRLGAAVYAFLAALFAHRAAARFAPPLLAAVCAAALWLGSPLFHYTVAEPAMAHAPATAVSSLLFLSWLRAREAPERFGRWVVVGFAGGLLVAIQRYDVYLLLPAAASAAATVRSRWRTKDAAARRRTALAVAGATAAFALAVLPLVLLAVASPDRFLLNPEVIRSQMVADWHRPHVLPLLFSSNGGFFAWTPLALPSVLGLVLLVRRQRRVGLLLLLTLALGVYVLASNASWWAGWSFGARRLTEAYPVLVVGLCAFVGALLRRPWLPVLALLAAFVLQSLLFSAQVRRRSAVRGDATSFTSVAQGAVADFHSAVGHPGSWPVNWVFALRHGVTPDRFDELFGRVPQERVSVRFGSPEDGVVRGRGWSRLDPDHPGRWAEQAETTVLLTLTVPIDRRLRLKCAAARHPDGREQSIEVTVNGRQAGTAVLAAVVAPWEVVVPASAWREGLNEVRFAAAWRLSRAEAWAVGDPPFVGWRLEELAVEPAP